MDEDTEEYEDHGDGKSSISADLIRGHINTIILRSLYDRDKYGYEIMNDINQKSHGQYTLKQPTLYSALKRLENQGYIQAYWKTDEVSSGGRRKYFRLTESGKEITEKNQAEWEYSRTVIDNLISDKNFDFSQPAPTPVDFRLLRQSTSRVPTGGGNDNAEDDDEQDETEPQPAVTVLQEPVIEAVTFTSVHETSVVLEPEDIISDETEQDNKNEAADGQTQNNELDEVTEESITDAVTEELTEDLTVNEEQAVAQQAAAAQQITVAPEEESSVNIPVEQPITEPATLPEEVQPTYNARDAADIAAAEEQRRISHEIYEKLIAGDFEKSSPEPEPEEVPAEQNNIPEEPAYNIYATRPETERDYRNLVDRIFEQTVRQPAPQPAYEETIPTPAPTPVPTPPPQPQPEQQPIYQQPPIQIFEQPVLRTKPQTAYSDFGNKAAEDGLNIQTIGSDNSSEKAKRTTYNRGATLFTCSLIVGGIILLEFILCIILMDKLEISIAYPFVILALGLVDILVCGILFGAGYGKQVRKPTSQGYIITSIITTALIILIIVIFAIILNVNWSVTTDVLSKVVIPCIVSLNIPVFTLSFYLLTK